MDDTHPEVARRQVELLRGAGFERRVSLALSLSHNVIQLSRRALREQMPEASDEDVLLRWVGLQYGEQVAADVREHVRRQQR